MFNNNNFYEMKTNENPKEEKQTSKKKNRKFLTGLLIGAGVGIGAYVLYTNKDARNKVTTTGKKVLTTGKNFITGMFKKKGTDPCIPNSEEKVILIKETFVPDIKTPNFEHPRRHRRENSNWAQRSETTKLNVK